MNDIYIYLEHNIILSCSSYVFFSNRLDAAEVSEEDFEIISAS